MNVNTYEDLEFWIRFFKEGNNVILSSDPGMGKSFAIDSILSDTEHTVISSHATPLAIYKTLYNNIDKPIVIRDLSGMLYLNDAVSLLLMLTETKETRTINWINGNNVDGDTDLPPFFETRSPVCIEINDTSYMVKRCKPLLSRMWLIRFMPTNKEILNKLSEMRKYYGEGSDDVYEFIDRYMDFSEGLSLRLFQKGISLYKHTNGQGWEAILFKEMKVNEKIAKVRELMIKYENDKERLSNWNGSRASYYMYKKKVISV